MEAAPRRGLGIIEIGKLNNFDSRQIFTSLQKTTSRWLLL